MSSVTFLLLCIYAYIEFSFAKNKIIKLQSKRKSASNPVYYGLFSLSTSVLLSFLTVLFFIYFENITRNIGIFLWGLCVIFLIIMNFKSRRYINPKFKPQKPIEQVMEYIFVTAGGICIAVTAIILLSVVFEAMHFFSKVPLIEFLAGTSWDPDKTIPGATHEGSFGSIPVFLGTILITIISLVIAVPLGLMSAIYLNEYASSRFRNIVKPALEMLAGIPTIIYGYFAALFVGPFIRDISASFGLNIASESAISAGIVMGVMIVPYVLSLSDDVLHSIPMNLRDASAALGATKAESITKVVLPAAFSGLVGSILLAVSRAIGETMIVVMAAGVQANLTFNPFAPVTTVTVQIVSLLMGEQEFGSVQTLAAFALAFMLFIITLGLNLCALIVAKKHRALYEY